MNCPVCNTKMDYWEDRLDFTVMEYEYRCQNCKRYLEHFITGSYEIGIKHQQGRFENGWDAFQWSYNDPLVPGDEQAKKDAIQLARQEHNDQLA